MGAKTQLSFDLAQTTQPGPGFARVIRLPLARNTDPPTSHAAAHSVRSIASEHHTRIIGALYMPATATEIAAATGLTMVQVCRRLPEMEALGIAQPTGKTRATASGRQSREWERCAPNQQGERNDGR